MDNPTSPPLCQVSTGGFCLGGMLMKARLSTLVVFFLVVATQAVASSLIYSNDFESNSTAGFSGSTTLTQAPSSANFLGPLSNGATATLTLNGVGNYTSLNLSFDLYAIYSLDGDSGSVANGVVGHPDYFTVKVNDVTTLFNYTFSNGGGLTQSYGGVGSPAGTGSDPLLTGQLMYPHYDQWPPGPGDYTYRLSLDIVLNGDNSIAFNFIGNSGQAWPDEDFGIDNVRVAATPLPATLPLFATGLGALGLLEWRRKRKARTSA
jgi:hypothetical protein